MTNPDGLDRNQANSMQPNVDALKARIHEVSALESKCRDVLQYESVFRTLIQERGLHAQICSLLDFIGDSEIALLSVASPEQRRALDSYFLAYGILQLMYSRQVALKAVLTAFKVSTPDSFKRNSLTIARDRVIGHPVTNDGAAHVIARHTLSENGFEYWSYRGPEIERSQKVDYEALLDAHLDAMVDGLGLLFRQLARIENERRECMRQTPLTPIFRGISYATQCMVAAIVEEKYRTLFPANSDIVLSALGSFRAELVKRYDDDWAADVVDHVVEGTRMLRSIFPPADEKASSQFKIVADGVDLNMKRLIELASEIDAKEAQQIE